MEITLYRNSAESNRMDKLPYLEKITTLKGYLRGATSITTPSISIELGNRSNILTSDNHIVLTSDNHNVIIGIENQLVKCNYAYIKEFNRYYFITDIISERTNLWTIELNVDVLSSFKDNILKNSGFITRNQYTYDELVRDDRVSYYYDKDVIEYTPPTTDSVNLTFNSDTSIIGYNYTLAYINDDATDFNHNTYSPPSDLLSSVSSWVVGANSMYIVSATYPSQISYLRDYLYKDKNLASYMLSIMCYPFEIPTRDVISNLKLGDTELSLVQIKQIKGMFSNFNVVADFTIEGTTFMDYEPYTIYEIYLPYLSWVTLNADDILNKRLLVIYTIDYSNGASQVSIVDDTDKKIIYTNTTQLGVQIPINITNATEVNNNRLSNNIGLGLGLASSTISTSVGLISGNPIAVVGGLMGGAKSITSYIDNNNKNYSYANGNVGSGASGVYLPQQVRIRKTTYKPKNYNDDYATLEGRPLNKYDKLSNYSGYTEVGNIHLEGIDDATSSEINSIETLLKNGVIL